MSEDLITLEKNPYLLRVWSTEDMWLFNSLPSKYCLIWSNSICVKISETEASLRVGVALNSFDLSMSLISSLQPFYRASRSSSQLMRPRFFESLEPSRDFYMIRLFGSAVGTLFLVKSSTLSKYDSYSLSSSSSSTDSSDEDDEDDEPFFSTSSTI